MKLNKKGASYVGLVVSMIILLSLVGIVGGFSVYVARHKQKVVEQTEISQEIGAQIAEVYNAPWGDLSDETIETKYGPLEVTYEQAGETEFATNALNVTFDKDGEQSTYVLERSVYYE